MITSYYPSNPHSDIPTDPFVKIGEITHHYSTGTQYEMVYSDDPKGDIPSFLDRLNFRLAGRFRPTMVRNGVECSIQLFRNHDHAHNVYLLVPVENARIKIGNRQVLLSADEVREMTLKKLFQMG